MVEMSELAKEFVEFFDWSMNIFLKIPMKR